MAFDPLSAAFELGRTAIEKIWPDPVKQAQEIRKLEELRQSGDLARMELEVKLLVAQLGINKTEAAHKSVFVAGWRPFVGWVGGASLAYAALLHPMLLWMWAIAQSLGWIPAELTAPPYVESAVLGSIVTGMLGVGAMRSHDKAKGTQTDSIK